MCHCTVPVSQESGHGFAGPSAVSFLTQLIKVLVEALWWWWWMGASDRKDQTIRTLEFSEQREAGNGVNH